MSLGCVFLLVEYSRRAREVGDALEETVSRGASASTRV